MYYSAKPFSPIGEAVKTTRVFLLLLAVSFFFSTPGLAQSHPHPSFSQQHKESERYQKHLIKEHRKLEKKQAKAAKASRNRHH